MSKNIDTSKWKSFKLSELFEIKTTKKKFNAVDINFNGQFAYVVRSEKNNGIRGYINENAQYLNQANTISFGQDTATMFYQKNPYFTGDKIKIFVFREKELQQQFNEYIAFYLIAILKISFSRFNWGNSSYEVNILKEVSLLLPVDSYNNPDWEFMQEYIKQSQNELLSLIKLYERLLSSGGDYRLIILLICCKIIKLNTLRSLKALFARLLCK